MVTILTVGIIALALSIWWIILKYRELYPDPLYKCSYHRDEICLHVDGMNCDMKTCDIKDEHEIFILEQELGIRKENRMYNQKKSPFNKVTGS